MLWDMFSVKFWDFIVILFFYYFVFVIGFMWCYLFVDFCGDNLKKSEYNIGIMFKFNIVFKVKLNVMV